jgi:hypothetical protein
MANTRSLTDQTIKEIIRQKAMLVPTKIVAKKLNVTPDQVAHYWRTSPMYKPSRTMSPWPSADRARNMALQKVRRTKANARLLEQAKASLRKIIDEPKVPCKPYKVGNLEW